MSFQLNDKVAIVTGASSGLGRSISLCLAKCGASVTLSGRDDDRLNAVKEECKVHSGGVDRFHTVLGDVTDPNIRENIVSQTADKFGHIDILVNCAGGFDPKAALLTATPESYDNIMDVNVKSVFFMIQQTLPHLEQTKGCIVNVSSIMSEMAATPTVLYPISKAAIDHMTRCLALDLGSKGIRVNSVNPSFVPTTRLWRVFGEKADEMASKYSSVDAPNHPLNERCVTSEEVADVVMFLVSPSSAAITGECIMVDNGRRFNGMLQVKKM